MLLRCGGNVIDVGRRQIALVATAALILLAVSVYSIGLLHGARYRDVDWIQPTPIDNVLQRAARDRLGRVEHVEKLDSPKREVTSRQKTNLKTTGGLTIFHFHGESE